MWLFIVRHTVTMIVCPVANITKDLKNIKISEINSKCNFLSRFLLIFLQLHTITVTCMKKKKNTA